MARHGQICQSCDNFTVEQVSDGTLKNSCPKAPQLVSRETQSGGHRESCGGGGYTPKQNHEDEVEE
jgi:hypothetical protein